MGIHLCLNVRFWTGSFGILRDERSEPTNNWNTQRSGRTERRRLSGSKARPTTEATLMMCPPPRLCMSGNLHSKVFGLAEQSGSAAPPMRPQPPSISYSERRRTASAIFRRKAAGRFCASGSSDRPKGLAAVQAEHTSRNKSFSCVFNIPGAFGDIQPYAGASMHKSKPRTA